MGEAGGGTFSESDAEDGGTMTKRLPDSARLILVPAFVAAATHTSNVAAGKALGVNDATIGRRAIKLEKWLRRWLIATTDPFTLTEEGEAFLSTARKILELIDEADLHAALSKTRISPDGTVTIEGVEIASSAAKEIGQLLVGSRGLPYTPPVATAPVARPPLRVSPSMRRPKQA